ncbi:MAG: hypothetical protein ACO1SX_20200 [Actinomycetota bacterium]
MRRRAAIRLRSTGLTLALLATLLLLAAGRAWATQGISYRWQSPRVSVTWAEGNSTPFDAAMRRQVGHWKRVAETLWAEKPQAPPLQMTVSFFGPEIGSDGPAVKLRAGNRSATVDAPLTEARVAEALFRVRDGATASPAPKLPPDDSEGRVSSTGEWIASISWRGGGPEIWLLPPAPNRAFRIPFPSQSPDADPLILTEPRWAPQSRRLAWIQGGRLAFFEGRRQQAQLLTPPDRKVIDFEWSPFANLILVRFDDDTFQILDLRRSKAMAMSDLLRDALPMGEFFWAPSGHRLLFRTQSQVVTANLSPPRAAVNAVDRFLNRLVGDPEPPKSVNGPNEERLAVLDLAGQRLDTYPVAGTPLEGAALRSVLWSPKEDAIYGVASVTSDGPMEVVRFPLGAGGAASVLHKAPAECAALGRRGPDADPRYVFLQGRELLSVNAAGAVEALPSDRIEMFEAAAGPNGGYLGVEGEEITDDEPAQAVVLEDLAVVGPTATRQRFAGGLWASVDRKSPVYAEIRSALGTGVVDFDLHPVPGKEVAVLMRSPGGRAGELFSVSADASAPSRPLSESVSKRLSEAKELIDVKLVDDPFDLVDARSGMEAFAVRYQTLSGRRMLIAGAAIALLAVGLFLARRRRRCA